MGDKGQDHETFRQAERAPARWQKTQILGGKQHRRNQQSGADDQLERSHIHALDNRRADQGTGNGGQDAPDKQDGIDFDERYEDQRLNDRWRRVAGVEDDRDITVGHEAAEFDPRGRRRKAPDPKRIEEVGDCPQRDRFRLDAKLPTRNRCPDQRNHKCRPDQGERCQQDRNHHILPVSLAGTTPCLSRRGNRCRP